MDKISETLKHSLGINKNLFEIKFFGTSFQISETMVTTWIVCIVIIILALIFAKTSKFTQVPNRSQNAIESLVEVINNFIKGQVGHHWRSFAPYFGSILLFLAFANIIAIFNVFPTSAFFYKVLGISAFEHIPTYQFKPPTKDINIPATLAIMSMGVVLFGTISKKGFKGFLKTFVHPSPIMLPFKILDFAIRPLSLTLRLFGNVLAAYLLMEIVISFTYTIFPAFPSLYFDLFDGILQAFIFIFLSSMYLGENLEID